MDDKAVSFPDQNRHDAVSRLPWICRNSAGITAGFRDWRGSEGFLGALLFCLLLSVVLVGASIIGHGSNIRKSGR